MSDKDTTLVVFRKWKKPIDDGILALFPAEDQGNGYCLSYAHIGQHSGADYKGCIANSRPATLGEYAALKVELERIGYKFKVIKRYTRR